MNKRLLEVFRRHEIFVVAALISVVFVGAMAIVAWMLRSSTVTKPYDELAEADLKRVYATGYLRFKEEDGTPYLKVELHNGTMWWIRNVEFSFNGRTRKLSDSNAFRPLHSGAVRVELEKGSIARDKIEYDLKILKASGFPPAMDQIQVTPGKIADKSVSNSSKN